MESHNLIPESQCGFRKGKSCCDNLAHLLLFVEEAFFNNETVYSAFLDVAGAFPSVDSVILINILANYVDCSARFIKFIKYITYENRVYTSVLKEEFRLMFKGLGQGRVMSPILYLLYTAMAGNGIPESVDVNFFADDKSIHAKNKKELSVW